MPTVQPYSATAQVKSLAGTAALPGITFTGDTDTGFYSPAANQVAITTGGVQRLLIGSDGSITPSGSLLFPAGTASAPSLSFAGDTNTGIYSPGADQVAISTGGSGRLFVDASGNVGVATGTPSYRLEVNGTISQSSQGTSSALIQAVNAGGIFYHGLDNSAGTTFGHAYAAALWHSGAYPILFATNGSERLRITSAGLVGVGTSSPSNAFQIESDANSDQGVWVRNSNTGSSASSNVYVNSAAGQLLFRAHSAAHSVWPATALISSSSGLTGGLAFNTGAAAPLAFLINNSERLRITSTGQLSHIGAGSSGSPAVNFSGSAPSNSLVIDSSGNVGINTAAGGASGFGTFFKIKTTSSSPGFFLENGAADSWWGVYGGTSAADSAAIVYPSTGSIRIATSTSVGVGGFSEKIRITSAGLVGIGTSAPTENLTIYGASSRFSVTGPSGSSVILLGNQNSSGANNPSVIEAANGALYFGGGNSWSGGGTFDYTMTLTNDNKVGIGTTNPSTALSIGAFASSSFNGGVCLNRGSSTYNFYEASDGTNTVIFGLDHTLAVAKIGSVNSCPIGFFTGNTERLRITSAGLVGVGTSSPVAQLHVDGSGSQNIRVSSTTHSNFIQAGCGSGSTYHEYKSVYRLVDTDNGERLRITSAGLVGIGTSSPSYSLDVSGIIQAGNGFLISQNGGSAVRVGAAGQPDFNNPGSDLYFSVTAGQKFAWGNSANRTDMTLDSSGRLGIGTTSPAVNAHIFGSQAALRIESSNTDARLQLTSSSGTWVVGNSVGGTGNYLSFYDVTASSERARIDSSGRLGIGTSSPSFTAHVSGAKNTTQLFVAAPTISAVNDFTQIGFGLSNTEFGLIRLGFDNPSAITNSYFSFFNNNGSGLQESLRIDSSGRVGIGTSSPIAPLQVVTTSAAYTTSMLAIGEQSNATGKQLYFGMHTTDGKGYIQSVHWGTSYKELLLNPNGGNVGIGTTSPGYALDIQGNQGVGLQIYETSSGNNRRLRITQESAGVTYDATFSTANNTHRWLLGGSEAARLDANGRLLVGTSTNNTTFNSRLQVKSDNTTASAIVIDHYENDTSGGIVFLAKSRSATVGTMTVVQNGDTLGEVQFWGADGTQHRQGASIKAQVDGTPGANDMPGRLVFSTTADGASSPTERLRITSAGLVGVGTSSPSYSLDISGIIRAGNGFLISQNGGSAVKAGAAGQPDFNNPGSDFYFSVTAGQKFAWGNSANRTDMTLDSSGRLGIGTTSPGDVLDTAAGNYRGITIKCGTTTNRPTLSFFNTADSLAAYIQAIGSSLAFGRMGTDYGGHTETARLDSSGRLGIGTSSPSYLLDVASSVAQVGNSTDAFIQYKSTAGNWHVGANSSNAYVFYAGTYGSGTERARIDSSGRLLVGLSSATGTNKLVVRNSDPLYPTAVFGASTASNGYSLLGDDYTPNQHNLILGIEYSSCAPIIGYSCKPSTTIDNTYLSSQSQYSTKPSAIKIDSEGFKFLNTDSLSLRTVNSAVTLTERMRITSSGNVGIGTASPNSRLAVNGSITESTDGGTTYHNVVTAQDIGTDPNQVPLNQFLGQLAFMDEVGDVPTASAPPQDNLSVNFEYVSNTSIKIRMRGTDGVVRSVTLTLS